MLSLDEELMDDTYCEDVDNTVVVFDTIVEESVVTVLDVDVAVEGEEEEEDVEVEVAFKLKGTVNRKLRM